MEAAAAERIGAALGSMVAMPTVKTLEVGGQRAVAAAAVAAAAAVPGIITMAVLPPRTMAKAAMVPAAMVLAAEAGVHRS